MVKKFTPPIKYTDRDFQSIKQSLIDYAKKYYPNTAADFNEASFGAFQSLQKELQGIRWIHYEGPLGRSFGQLEANFGPTWGQLFDETQTRAPNGRTWIRWNEDTSRKGRRHIEKDDEAL